MTVAEFIAGSGGDTLFAAEKYAGHMSYFYEIYTPDTLLCTQLSRRVN